MNSQRYSPTAYTHYSRQSLIHLKITSADSHRRYTGSINARMRVTGHLWQSRSGSVVATVSRKHDGLIKVSRALERYGDFSTDPAGSPVHD